MSSSLNKRLDLIQDKHVLNELMKFFKEYQAAGSVVEVIKNKDNVLSIIKLIEVLAPMQAEGQEKIRLGGERDGGYVMLDPGQNGIVYSFGISPNSPWDLEMAKRGFKVYQYDASLSKEPDEHPNIFFHKYFVADKAKDGPYKTIPQIILENNHQKENDLILQMDIEGAEWDILNSLPTEYLCKFKQIIIEIHRAGLSIYNYSILERLRKTHTPVHFHYNNHVRQLYYLPQLEFIYSGDLIEMTYARNDSFTFSNCTDYFPTALDRPNGPRHSFEIPIGYFNKIIDPERYSDLFS